MRRKKVVTKFTVDLFKKSYLVRGFLDYVKTKLEKYLNKKSSYYNYNCSKRKELAKKFFMATYGYSEDQFDENQHLILCMLFDSKSGGEFEKFVKSYGLKMDTHQKAQYELIKKVFTSQPSKENLSVIF
jgi:hypothetical protein